MAVSREFCGVRFVGRHNTLDFVGADREAGRPRANYLMPSSDFRLRGLFLIHFYIIFINKYVQIYDL